MKQKTKYYLIGFAALVVLIIGYHFLAASQAEDQIDEAIQEEANKSEAISVQYSSIDVAPFSGNLSMSDLTFIFGDHIERARHIKLDLGYLDFLNIYFGGIAYGLENLYEARITLLQPSYVNRSGLEELKSDTLHITYRGQALDGLRSAINGTNFGTDQSIEVRSSGIRLRLPDTPVSQVGSEEFTYSGAIAEGNNNFWINGSHEFKLDSLIWTPSEAFQTKYSFFIKGFGYPTNAIPFESTRLQSNPASEPDVLQIDASVKSELALLSGSGFIHLDDSLKNSTFQDMVITVTEFSESFSRVIQNIERLLSVKLPRDTEGIRIKISGTLNSPAVEPFSQ
jgi:hypothetical protein